MLTDRLTDNRRNTGGAAIGNAVPVLAPAGLACTARI